MTHLETPVLQISGLNKNFGKIQAINNLDLSVYKGNIFGILGPNGSGKTTTLGCILGIVNSNSGSYKWFGEEASHQNRKKIGAILESPNFYPYLSAKQNLNIIAEIRQKGYDSIDEVLKTVDLFDRKDSKFKTFSFGMKQRLAIAAALLGNPEVLILDEPTNGLDPVGIADIRTLILKIAKKGITIIFASHILDEVQKICTHVAVLKKGKKLFDGEVDVVLSSGDHVELAAENLDLLKSALEKFENLDNIKKVNGIILAEMKSEFDIAELNSFLLKKGIVLNHLSKRKQSLEDQFLKLVKE